MVVVCTDITLLIRVSSQLVQRGSKTPEKKLVHYHSLGRKSWRTEKNSSERKKKTATNEVDRKSWLVTYLEKEQNFGKKPSLNYLVKTVTVKLQERAAASRFGHEDVQSSAGLPLVIDPTGKEKRGRRHMKWAVRNCCLSTNLKGRSFSRSPAFNKKQAPVRLAIHIRLDMPGHTTHLVEQVELVVDESEVGIRITNLGDLTQSA